MANEIVTPIPARLKNVAKGGHVAGASDIVDDALNKEQSVVNQERIADVARLDGRIDVVEQKVEDIGDAIQFDQDGDLVTVDGDDFQDPEARGKIPTIGAILDGYVNISQNTSTGHVDITVGGTTTPVASGDEIDHTPAIYGTDEDFAISDSESNAIVVFNKGHIRTKNFDSGINASQTQRGLMSAEDKVNLDKSNIITSITEDNDFEIADGKANKIVVFSDGHIRTKHFNSAKASPTEDAPEDIDFALSDEDKNKIAVFSGGHIKTKNFDSSILREKTALYVMELANMTDMVYSGWSVANGSVNNSTNFGWDNKMYLGREIDVDGKSFIWDFKIASGGVAYFGSCGTNRITDMKQSLISVNFGNGKLNLHRGLLIDQSPITAVLVSANFDSTDYTSKKYRVVITRERRGLSVKLYDITLSPIKLAEVSSTMDGKGQYCGYLYDSPCAFSTDATIYIYGMYVNTTAPLGKPICIVEGDSITEGYALDDASLAWGDLWAAQYPKDFIKISGRSNGDIKNLLARLSGEVQYINSEYVMVTIGTNNGWAEDLADDLQDVVDYVCDTLHRKLVLNHIPAHSNMTLTNHVNGIIDGVIANNLSKGIRCVNFDIATAVDGDISQGQDATLFVQDGTHPNAAGNQKMFEQLMIDLPELFY